VLCQPAETVSIITQSTKEKSKTFRYYREYYGKNQWLSEIDAASRARMESSIDWNLAAQFGYRRFPEPYRSRNAVQ
jgi:hypothetical protein